MRLRYEIQAYYVRQSVFTRLWRRLGLIGDLLFIVAVGTPVAFGALTLLSMALRGICGCR